MATRIIYALLCVVCGFLSGCEQQAPGTLNPNTPSPSKQIHIGLLLFSDARLPQSRGFLDGLKELGFEEGRNLNVTTLNANNDQEQLGPLSEKMSQLAVDMVVAAGGLEAEIMKPITEKTGVPMLVLYINSIIERKFVKDRRDPGWNVTGVDNLNAELSGKRLELLQDLAPQAKKILVLYDPKIEPSYIGLKHVQEQALKLNLTIDARPTKNAEDVKTTLNAINPGEVDAMVLVPTAYIDGALKEVVLPMAERLNIPVMAHSRPMAEAGATAAYGTPLYDIGKQAARLAEKILSGVSAQNIPFEIPNRYDFTVNEAVLARLAIPMSELVRSQVTDYIK